MLSLDLFNSRFEKKLHEGAIDNITAHLIEPLSKRAADIRTQLRSGRLDSKQIAKLEKEYEDLVQKRLDIILDRQPKNEQQVPSKQDPFAYVKPEPRGIGDIQDPRAKMASLAQKAKKGPLANVGAGLKGFLTGKDEPLDEQEPQQSPRAFGVANFQRLVKANMGNYPKMEFEFPNAKENIKLDKAAIDLISDYYDGLENDQAKNFFIYRVLPSGAETRKILKSLGWQEQQQQELPGIPTQGELPLSEQDGQKKKSEQDNLKAGDVKTAREIEKIRAKYPAARSDIEALARAEIDSTERSQEQIGRIRSANSRQDELLKQIMNIDREQSQEIDTLDSEKDSIEAQLDRVQSLNDRLTQAVSQMSGTKVSAPARTQTAQPATIDLIPGAPADREQPAKPAAITREPVAPTPSPRPQPDVMGSMARTIQSLPKDAPGTAKEPEEFEKEPEEKPIGSLKSLRPKQAANVDDFKLVAEGVPQDAIQRYLAIDAETDVEAVKKAIQAIHKDPALSANSKARLLGYIFALVRKHKLPMGRAYYQFLQRYMEEGQSVKEHITKEPRTARERDAMIDKIQRMMAQERNPANLQIMRKDIEMLKTKYRDLQEDSSTSSEAAERAILNRIMVAHTDLLKQFGPQKVMQAAEEVAYNVGDLPEIGTSDVSGWVQQVKQILGVPEELDEKWSAKYKKSINCANPKGFSQKAHCAGRKKK